MGWFCNNLTNVTLAGVVNIQSNAFAECTSLASVTIAGGVIGFQAFFACSTFLPPPGLPQPTVITGLSNLTLGNGVSSIGNGAFQGALIGSVTIPDSITYIPDDAFAGCAELTNVIISASVTNIEDFAFDQDPKLTNVLFLGNAPAVVDTGDQGVFAYDANVTVYYLPGTTGWSNTFGTTIYYPDGAPTALWNPVIQTGDGSLGVSSGQFGFNITGIANIPIVVEACTNLADPVWVPLQSMTLTNGSVFFRAPNWTNFPVRYYGIGFP